MTASSDPLACVDLIAYRRFAYAKAAAEDGDFAAAIEILEQTLERAPDWAPATFALGEAREKLGDLDGAADAYRATLSADPADAQGAAARLALIGRGAAPSALPQAYVARLFDEYAPHFNAHLTEKLGYRGPELIVAALDDVAPGQRFARTLDVGCGAGLMGRPIRARVDRLVGVDLAPAMVAKARESGLYDELATSDALAFLAADADGYDLIVAADAFCYFGDLATIMGACAEALAPGGLLAFSIETFEGEGFRLGSTMRFAHAPRSVETLAHEAGLETRLIRKASTRLEKGAQAPGAICVFERPNA